MSPSRPISRLSSLLGLLLFTAPTACVWTAWTPNTAPRDPKVVVATTELSQELALERPWVDELDCFSHRCDKRFRVVVDRPGELTVSAALDLTSQDQQARIVLESVRGVIARAGTGRGDRTDASLLALRETVEPGVYFVLIQSLGGKVPYELRASLAADEYASLAPPPAPPPVPEPSMPREIETQLTKVRLGAETRAAYDPMVVFRDVDSFVFARPVAGPDAPAGAVVDSPGDRQIRRFIAEALVMKGFRQADGREQADLIVGFSTSDRSRGWYAFAFPMLYHQYDFGPERVGVQVDPREALVVDIVDARTGRLAWHASSTKSVGPGVTPGTKTTRLAREAVADVIGPFPPN